MEKTTTCFRLEKSLLDKIKSEASEEGRNTSNMIIRILELHFANKEQDQ
jgi:predicted DNA binding CopG/RHH family protein